MPVEILILGAGAIGAFHGSRLAVNAGVKVSSICRSNLAAVTSHGFRVRSPVFGNYSWSPNEVFASTLDARRAEKKWDFILVSTKALPDVDDDSAGLEGLVDKDTSIVLIQNGLGIEEPYHKRFKHAAILSAVTIISAAQPEPGIIQHNAWTRTTLGAFPKDSEETDHKAKLFVQLLVGGGLNDASAYSADNLQLLRWHKTATNAAMNPSSVLAASVDVADMVHDSDMREHLRSVMQEVFDAARAVTGQAFPRDFPSIEQTLKSVERSRGIPSMLSDWRTGRRMELEVILGNPLRMAQARGIPMPRLQSMYALLQSAQRNRKALAAARL